MNGQKLTIDDLREMARKKGGVCLSEVYINAQAKYRWRCSEGHEWGAIGSSVRRGSWCPTCSGHPKLTLDDMKLLASERGGKCLSTEYTDSKSHLEWECSEGHGWETTAGSIRQGAWCPVCAAKRRADLRRGDIEEFRLIANMRGGRCLSTEYQDAISPLKWECSEGHEWRANANSVKRGSWCPTCAGVSRLTIEDVRRTASGLGGKCISTEYKNIDSQLAWECSEGHRWKTAAGNIRSGRWCPTCAGNSKLTLDDMKHLAYERGGKCLSMEYRDNQSRLEWECSEGHKWEARAGHVRSGSWCPTCSATISAKGEQFASEILNETGHYFSKEHPDWLLYSHGRKLELDCLCHSRSIALEYQGQQHFEELPFFHRKEGAFKDQQERDEFKRQRCAENKVLLFEVRAVNGPTPEKVRAALARITHELAIPLEINPEYRQMLEEHDLAYYPTQDDQKAA